MSRRRNKYYDRKLKLQAVQDYLGGGGSLRTICKKHGIKDKKQLRNWIKWYNGHKTIELRGNACTTWGDSIAPAPATVLWMNVPLVNDLMREWLTRKQELASHAITKSEYLEWLLQWPASSDMAGKREPIKQWRKAK